MMRASYLTLVAAIILICGPGSAARANLVLNGNFGAQVTSLINPTYSPPTSWTATGSAGVDSGFPNPAFASDLNDAYIGTGSLSQTFSTTIGLDYTIIFYAGIDDFNLATDGNATFDAAFGDQDLISGPIPATDFTYGSYTEFTETLTADASSTTITFTGAITGQDGPFYLADVDVEPVAAPEPSAALVVASALGLLTLMRVRRA